MNRGAQLLYGYTAAEAVGKSMDMLVPPFALNGFREIAFGKLLQGKSLPPYTAVGLRKDGTRFPISVTAAPIRGAAGRVVAGAAIIRDISALKEAESTKALLASIVESAEDAIFGAKLDGTILSWNRGAEELYGYQADEIIGRSVSVLAPPERLQEQRAVLHKIQRGERVVHLETQTLKADGSLLDVSITVLRSPIERVKSCAARRLRTISPAASRRRTPSPKARRDTAFCSRTIPILCGYGIAKHTGYWPSMKPRWSAMVIQPRNSWDEHHAGPAP